MTPAQIAEDAIDAFIEQLAQLDHGLSNCEIEAAKARVMGEYADAANADRTINTELLAALELTLDRLECEGSGKKETWHAVDTARDVIARAKEHQ